MIFNPFDLIIHPSMKTSKQYSAEVIRNSPFGVPLKQIGDYEKERDTETLCGSRHYVETWVSLGTVDEETAVEIGAMSDDKKYIVRSNRILSWAFLHKIQEAEAKFKSASNTIMCLH